MTAVDDPRQDAFHVRLFDAASEGRCAGGVRRWPPDRGGSHGHRCPGRRRQLEGPGDGLEGPKLRADEPDGEVGPEQVPTPAEALAILDGTPARFDAAITLGLVGLRVGRSAPG